jgi:hypothetical protein
VRTSRGGSSLTGGWDGLTLLDLGARSQREIALADQPMCLVRLRA